jgi:hypothetical protein
MPPVPSPLPPSPQFTRPRSPSPPSNLPIKIAITTSFTEATIVVDFVSMNTVDPVKTASTDPFCAHTSAFAAVNRHTANQWSTTPSANDTRLFE